MRRNKSKLVVDVGMSIVGLRAVNGRYWAYRGDKRAKALSRIEAASEIITFNGTGYDLDELNKLSVRLRGRHLRIAGEHTDISDVYWPGILGASLDDTYKRHFAVDPVFEDTYEGSNQRDIYQTLMLWKKHKGSWADAN